MNGAINLIVHFHLCFFYFPPSRKILLTILGICVALPTSSNTPLFQNTGFAWITTTLPSQNPFSLSSDSFMMKDKCQGNENIEAYIQSWRKEAHIMMSRVLRWKRRDLRPGSGFTAAWIRQFGHVSTSLGICFFICKMMTLNQMISKDTQTLKCNNVVKDVSNSGAKAFYNALKLI